MPCQLRKIFGSKEPVLCAVCNKELGRYRYKPAKEWGISGMLCADCHIDKTKAFVEMENARKDEPEHCAICQKALTEEHDRNKPKWQWEMESGVLVCRDCYDKTESQYTQKMNFCSSCKGKLGMFFYHPKPAWKVEGNLCRECWDRYNKAVRA